MVGLQAATHVGAKVLKYVKSLLFTGAIAAALKSGLILRAKRRVELTAMLLVHTLDSSDA